MVVDANCTRARSTLSASQDNLSVLGSSSDRRSRCPLLWRRRPRRTQLGVGAPLDHAAGVEDEDLVHGLQAGQAVA